MMETKQKIILYVDDDEDDRELLTDAIQQANSDIEIVLAKNGLEALDYLLRQKKGGDPLPGLIVLDLNMPFLGGKETFQQLKADPDLQNVPIIVFTSSERPADKALFDQLGIEYIVKPTSVRHIGEVVNHLLEVCC